MIDAALKRLTKFELKKFIFISEAIQIPLKYFNLLQNIIMSSFWQYFLNLFCFKSEYKKLIKTLVDNIYLSIMISIVLIFLLTIKFYQTLDIHKESQQALTNGINNKNKPGTLYVLNNTNDVTIHQQNQNFTFFLSFLEKAAKRQRYLMFEVSVVSVQPKRFRQVGDDFQGLLIHSLGDPAQLDFKHQLQEITNIMDINGYYLGKRYLHIVVPLEEETLNLKHFISLIQMDEFDIIYQIKIRWSQQIPCPLDCGGITRGICHQGICSCKEPYLDDDCQINGIELKIGQQITVGSQINGTKYLYFQPKFSLEDDLKLDIKRKFFQKEEGGSQVAIMFEGKLVSYLPNMDDYSYFADITSSFTIKIENKLFTFLENQNRRRRLFLAIIYEDFSSILNDELKVSINYLHTEHDDDKKHIDVIWILIFVFIALAGSLFTILLAIIIYKFCFVSSIAAQQRPCIFRRPCSLTDGVLDKLMPLLTYEQMNQYRQNGQTRCSICLQEYLPCEKFRKTPCLHVFHHSCIDVWLKKAENCPVCRENLDRLSLETKQFIPQCSKPCQTQQIQPLQMESQLIAVYDNEVFESPPEGVINHPTMSKKTQRMSPIQKILRSDR